MLSYYRRDYDYNHMYVKRPLRLHATTMTTTTTTTTDSAITGLQCSLRERKSKRQGRANAGWGQGGEASESHTRDVGASEAAISGYGIPKMA